MDVRSYRKKGFPLYRKKMETLSSASYIVSKNVKYTPQWRRCLFNGLLYEPPRDKTNKMSVRPAKTQISLGICPVRSGSSLCAQLIYDPSFLHVDSEDSDQTGWMPRLIWVFAGLSCHFVGFFMRRLILIRPGSHPVNDFACPAKSVELTDWQFKWVIPVISS